MIAVFMLSGKNYLAILTAKHYTLHMDAVIDELLAMLTDAGLTAEEIRAYVAEETRRAL